MNFGFGFDSQTIQDVLKDTKFEGRYVNAFLSKREEIQQLMNFRIEKLRKDIENVLQRNAQLAYALDDGTEESIITERAEAFTEEYLRINAEINALHKEAKDLAVELSEGYTNRENLRGNDKKRLEQVNKLIGETKALSQIYINFIRVRWVKGGEKLFGYVAKSDKDFERFESSKSEDGFERFGSNWEKLEKSIL